MPTLLQASISSDPAGAEIFFPSTVRFTSAMIFRSAGVSPAVRRASRPAALSNFKSRYNRNNRYSPAYRAGETPALRHYRFPSLLKRARLSIQVIFKLFSELLHERHGGHSRRISQRQNVFPNIFSEREYILSIFFFTPPPRWKRNKVFS